MAERPISCLFIGAGKMGSALLEGWQLGSRTMGVQMIRQLDICDPNAQLPTSLQTYEPLRAGVTPASAAPAYSLIVLAVKPQQAQTALAPWAAQLKNTDALLSIMAGVSLAHLRDWSGVPHCVRCMPNLPSALGVGALVFCGDAPHAPMLDKLFSANGEVFWLDPAQEALLHSVTALSGSGPAYVFYLAELLGQERAAALGQGREGQGREGQGREGQGTEMEWLQDGLVQSGESLGLPVDLAMRLAEQTILGARMQLAQSQASARALYTAVTSKGGTTEAALQILQNPKTGWPAVLTQRAQFQSVLARAMQAAHARSVALAQDLPVA